MATRGGDYDDGEEEVITVPDDNDDAGDNREDEEEDNEVIDLGRNVVVESFDSCREEKGGKEVVLSGEGEGSSTSRLLDSSCLPACSVCMEQWTSEGSHRVCCIPCGHVYGRSCLEKWIQQKGRKKAKCPQCGRNYLARQIINLYAPEIAVANNDLERKVQHLSEKNESLSAKNEYLNNLIEVLYEKRKKRICLGKISQGIMPMGFSEHSSDSESDVPQNHIYDSSTNNPFFLQIEYPVDKAQVLDTDALNQIAVISRSTHDLGCEDVITKLSLVSPRSMENVRLPPDTGTIKDLHIAPHSMINSEKLILLASLGKRLSILSLESNTVVLKHNLLAPAWSCSWDLNNPDLIYAGLQNGMVLVFDIRQTAKPLYSNIGLSTHPVHTVHVLQNTHVNTPSALITACSDGPCLWSGYDLGERSVLMPNVVRHSVCTSFACGKTSDGMVVSFRPRIISNNGITSKHSQFSSHTATGSYITGNHVRITRYEGNSYRECQSVHGTMHSHRMSKSVIVPVEGSSPLFVFGEESYKGLCIRDMHFLNIVQSLQPHQHPILDIKYSSHPTGPGLLSCLSKNLLQVFSSH